MTYYHTIILKKLKKIPITLSLLLTVVCCFGFVALWSAANGSLYPWAYKQILNFIMFLPIVILIAITDTKVIYRLSYWLYFISLLLLIAVEFFGKTVMGGKRWLDLGLFNLQPSELAKIALVLVMARYFHQVKAQNLNKIQHLFILGSIVIIPVILVIKQPDLGTGLLMLMSIAIVFFAAGINTNRLIFLAISTLLTAPIAWYMLYDYQRQRLLTFLNPKQDALGAGYNIIQAKIAIGSGGFFGKGLTLGTQSQLSFLPEHQTDFIFASIAEEFGFMGSAFLLILYSLIILISLSISLCCKSVFSKLMVIGVTAVFFSHIFINIGMQIQLLPVVGIPLPFISYGRVIMGSMMIGFGLIINAAVHPGKLE